MNRVFYLASCGALLMLALLGPADAHEMFLKPRAAFVAADSRQTILLMNGTFEKSDNSITRDRMADVSIVAHGKTIHPDAGSWSDDEKKTLSMLDYKTGAAGTYVIGVSTRPRIITMTPQDFTKYLEHDGVVDTLATFRAQNTLAQVRERYSKHVRAFVQVGQKRTADYAAPLAYPVEILLEKNPYALRVGDKLAFRVLFKGRPVANQVVRAGHEGFHGHDASGGHTSAHLLRTDAQGRAEFRLNRKAMWYLSLIHMQKIEDSEADYESNWATATFQLR